MTPIKMKKIRQPQYLPPKAASIKKITRTHSKLNPPSNGFFNIAVISDVVWNHYPDQGIYFYQDPCVTIKVVEIPNSIKYKVKIQFNFLPRTTKLLSFVDDDIFESLSVLLYINSFTCSKYALKEHIKLQKSSVHLCQIKRKYL